LLPTVTSNWRRTPTARASRLGLRPVVNIELGVAVVARNRVRMQEKFPGLTEDQYTLMAIGEFNDYESTRSCTVLNAEYDRAVLEAYAEYFGRRRLG
jgi:hypothetical protein